jgi:hypothetical protein
MAKKVYTNGQKLGMVVRSREMQLAGQSIRAICREFAIQPHQLREWRKKEAMLRSSRKSKKGVGAFRSGMLKDFEEPLVQWFLDMREAGVPVHIRHVVLRAQQLNPAFGEKTEEQKYAIARRLLIRNCIVLRARTRVSQRHPQEVADEARAFTVFAKALFSTAPYERAMVFNMDQTGVFFSMSPRTTLNMVGARTVHCVSSTNGPERCSVSLCISGGGAKLKPMVTFKGRPNGDIAIRQLPTFPMRENMELNCQDNAWVDEATMIKWIDRVLAPYLQENAAGRSPILVLDSYKVHLMDSIKTRIESLGVRLEYVPPGCTCLAQPVDVGIGRPFKTNLTRLWNDWILNRGDDFAMTHPPSRELLTTWINQAWEEISEETVQNAWRKDGYKFFD